MLIKAAINGGRSKAEHAAVPLSPEEQAAAVVQCLKAGAGAIHLHVRAVSDLKSSNSHAELQSGNESLYPEDVARTLLAVHAAAPQAQVGVSTGAWILPDPAARLQAVEDWKVLPGFASVNFSEDGAVELAKLLLLRGIDVEAGLCDADAAAIFLKSGLAASCIRALLEPQEQEMERALETVNAIEKVLALVSLELRRPLPLLLHGTEATVWPTMDEAIKRGYDLRIGLEDTLVLPDGHLARDNVELLEEALRRVKPSYE
ncbi:MAG TPA: 3-keto-5-aminohexanoate cleavage protein [Pyrinomonadaceae bacterium]|jgi:uncharacterized protein (DUF849 family)|nr:3-keto-5-aminohexanoate cleavage protein [Pyrinomonadaceae bacterium]